MAKYEDAEILKAALFTVNRAKVYVPAFASALSPIRTDQIAELLRAFNVAMRIYPFVSSAGAVSICTAGVNMLFVDQNARRTDRLYAIRHELGHIIQGDPHRQDGPVLLAESHYLAAEERIADLFAFADLVPRRWIERCFEEAGNWRTVRRDIRDAIEINYVSGWPADYLDDRAHLRLELYRKRAI